MADSETTDLLRRWEAGERAALDRLLELHLGWLRATVRKRLGKALRHKLDSGDLVQEAVMDFLRDGPRLRFASGDDFRRYMVRVILNVIADAGKWFSAKRRDIGRESSLAERDVQSKGEPTPFAAAAARDDYDRIRTVIELLPHDDQRVLLLRDWDGMPFEEIAADLGINYDAARMRYSRAMRKLREGLRCLKDENLDGLLSVTSES